MTPANIPIKCVWNAKLLEYNIGTVIVISNLNNILFVTPSFEIISHAVMPYKIPDNPIENWQIFVELYKIVSSTVIIPINNKKSVKNFFDPILLSKCEKTYKEYKL